MAGVQLRPAERDVPDHGAALERHEAELRDVDARGAQGFDEVGLLASWGESEFVHLPHGSKVLGPLRPYIPHRPQSSTARRAVVRDRRR
jgi:hypothetical protein